MRELIRKVLREDINLNSTPSGGSELDSLYGDDKIRWIEEYREHIEKLIPKIIKYFEYKFGDMLENISVVEKDVTYYGGESPRSGTKIVLKFLFKDLSYTEHIFKKAEIWQDLASFFNIDLGWSYTPLRVETESTTPNKR